MQPNEPDPGVLAPIGAWPTTLVLGVVTLILGLIVSFRPSASLNVIAVLIGLLMVIAGIFHLVRAFGRAESHPVWLAISGPP